MIECVHPALKHFKSACQDVLGLGPGTCEGYELIIDDGHTSVAGSGEQRVSERTRCGCAAANSKAMEAPIERPKTCTAPRSSAVY